MLLFAVSVVLVPLSNTITGPIPGGVANTTNASQVVNSSFSNISGEVNVWDLTNSSLYSGDYCGNRTIEEGIINQNSIKRVPIYIWVVLIFLMSARLISR